MRGKIALLWLVSMLCLEPSPIWAAGDPAPSTTWMTVLLNGRKIGHEEIQREVSGHAVITTQTLVMDIERNHRPTVYTNVSRSEETTDGAPVGFSMTTLMSAIESKVEGRRQADSSLELISTSGGVARRSITAWPEGALLTEGERQAMQAAASHPGSHYQLIEYNQASQEPLTLQVEVLGNERVELPDGIETLSHQRKTLRGSRSTQTVDLWLDTQGNLRKGSLSLLGRPFDIIACSKTCAMQPSQSLNMMNSAMIDSPRLITPQMLNEFLSYRVHVTTKAAAMPFVATDEQSVTNLGNGVWQINVYRASSKAQSPPTPADTQPNAWLQSDAPQIRQLAALAADGAESKLRVMGNLNSFVRNYLKQRGLDIGYASALEVARDRRGDCAEFAVLLAALARAQGIPARVVVGMIYADRYDNRSRVFVPHAW